MILRYLRYLWLPILFGTGIANADYNVAIYSSASVSSNGAWSGGSPDVWTPTASGATVATAEIISRLQAGTPVTITTTGDGAEVGDIVVIGTISWNTSKLTLSAKRDIQIDSLLDGSGAAQLALEYGQGAVAAGNTADYYT